MSTAILDSGPGAGLFSRRRSSGERGRHGALLALIVAVHVLLLLWFMASPTRQLAQRRHGTLTLISIENGKQVPSPPATAKKFRRATLPPAPVVIPNRDPRAADVQTGLTAASSAFAGATGGCALANRATQAIVSDPEAMAELAALPAGYRTSADAVMLWNGQWVAGDPIAVSGRTAAPLAAPVAPELRRVVEQVIAEASPDCREAPVGGPEFLPIPQQGRTTTLVVGSGLWRWSDLLRQCDRETIGPCTGDDSNSLIDQLF